DPSTQRKLEVLATGQRVEQRGELEHVADLTPQLGEAVLVEVGNSSVVDQHGAVVRGQQSHHVLQQHALARTGTSQQHRGAGVGNIEAHAAEHDAIAEALDDIVEADHSSTTAQNASSTR